MRKRDRELDHLAALRLELPQIPFVVGREPDVSLAVSDQPVWSRVRSRERVLADLAGLRVQSAELVCLLLREPERSVRSCRGIVRTRVRRGEVEFADGNGGCGENRNQRGAWESRVH